MKKINNNTNFHIFCTVRLTGDWTHTWDWKDRLVGSVLDDLIQDKEIRYTYDEDKQRILKNNVTDEEVTMYIDKYFDREGAIEKSHIFANDTKVATLEIEGEDQRFVYHHEDHLTGANVDTDSEGAVVQLLDYFPYGETWIDDHDEDYQNDYQFTGKERDDETGLSYYEARYYHSNIGRFISRDTWEGDLQDPQSLNKYSYVQNNPLKYRDPDGEERLSILIELPKGDEPDLLNRKGFSGHVGMAIDNDFSDYGPFTGIESKGELWGGVPGSSWWDNNPDVTTDGNASLQDVLYAIKTNKIAEGHPVFQVTAEITSHQANIIKNYWNELKENPGTYRFYGKQCTTTVAKSLGRADLIKIPRLGDFGVPVLRFFAARNYNRILTPGNLLQTLQKNLKNTHGANKGKGATIEKIDKDDDK